VQLEHAPVGAVAQRALTVPGAPGRVVRTAAVGGQIPQRVIADQDHVTPAAPVTAVGTALGDVSFAAKAQAAVATGAGLNVNASLVVHTQTMSDPVF
jgi:hypothetical protein